MKDLSPIAWALRPLKRYAEFSGRSSRAEFWWFWLFVMVVWMVVYFLMIGSVVTASIGQTEPSAGMVGALGVVGILLLLFWVGILIPSIAVQVRRLHDTNRSGWWLGGFYLAYAVYVVLLFSILGAGIAAGMAGGATAEPPPALGPMFVVTMIVGLGMFIYAIVLLVFYCQPGTTGDNRYGPDPYAPGNLEEVFG
jgi:uncharacterized membrane protein YhaH (DUF805 family)